jgi:hypothetical protein
LKDIFKRLGIMKMLEAGAEIFQKLEPELDKNRPAPQHWIQVLVLCCSLVPLHY